MALPEGLTARAASTADADAVFTVLAAAEQEVLGEVLLEPHEVVDTWAAPSLELSRDTLLVHDDGALVGVAQVNRGHVIAEVVASHRGRGVGAHLCDWATEVSRGRFDVLHQEVVSSAVDRTALLGSRGYAPWFTAWVLRLPVGARVADREPPPGVVVRPYEDGEERAVHAVVERAFGEWEGRPAMTFEDWSARVLHAEGFLRDALLVAVDEAEDVIGVCNAADSGSGEARETWVMQLAVAAEHRGRGIAQSLLSRAWADARSRGVAGAALATDSRTGALSLYEKLGLRVEHELETWRLDLTSRGASAPA